MDPATRLVICISSAPDNLDRRRAIRNSWLKYLDKDGVGLPPEMRSCIRCFFVLGKESEMALQEEREREGDMLFLDSPEGYGNLWRKTLTFLHWANTSLPETPSSVPTKRYYMHADDDSFVRLDLLFPLLVASPAMRFYWGYIWDPDTSRKTAPIRNTANKSHMPSEQYPLDFYPPFASGCGFVLSWDLVEALLAQPLPDYRLLDPPFGIHLTGTERCCIDPPVVPVHDERVRPYRPLPIFRHDSIVQHYLHPAEMRPFYLQATGAVEYTAADAVADARIGSLYDNLVGMGLLRR